MSGARRGPRRGLDLAGLVDERFADRFWSKVDPTGDCWLWTAGCTPQGYGQFTLQKGKFRGAHVVSHALAIGPIPPGLVVCHRCDTPPCVNPGHLFLGTQSDNANDMFSKGRGNPARGRANANSRLDPESVRAIRQALAGPGFVSALAREYGVSATTIRQVLSGATWRHVA